MILGKGLQDLANIVLKERGNVKVNILSGLGLEASPEQGAEHLAIPRKFNNNNIFWLKMI